MALMVAARLIVPLQVSGYDNVIDTPGLARRLACASCAHNQESRKSYLRGSGRERESAFGRMLKMMIFSVQHAPISKPRFFAFRLNSNGKEFKSNYLFPEIF